jgi:hypothetical protein
MRAEIRLFTASLAGAAIANTYLGLMSEFGHLPRKGI